MSADVHRRVRAVIIDDEGFAAEQVVHHAVDGFFVAGNDPRRQDDGVALFDLGVLVIVNRGPRQGRHRLALRAADHHAHFFRREVFHFAGMDQRALVDLDVAEILGDFRRTVHRASDEANFAAVFPSHVYGEFDAVNRRRETGDKKAALGAREYLLEFATHGAFAGRVALALDVGRVLQQGEYAFLAILSETVQVKKPVVGGRGINFEVAGVQYNAERRVNRKRHAIDQAVRYL